MTGKRQIKLVASFPFPCRYWMGNRGFPGQTSLEHLCR